MGKEKDSNIKAWWVSVQRVS